jgi:DNA-binding transcriptional LysR family regulator
MTRWNMNSREGRQVRVNALDLLGVLASEPILPEFWQGYPNMVVDLSLSDETVVFI